MIRLRSEYYLTAIIQFHIIWSTLSCRMKDTKTLGMKLTPSELVKKQLTGNGFFDDAYQKPRIV